MVSTLRQQVDTLTSDARRLAREKQLAEAMKFAQESKFESLEEKLAKSQTECATLQRQLAAAAKKQGGQAEEIAQQMVEMRDELEQLKEQQQEEAARAQSLQSEVVALRARARTFDAFGLGMPRTSPVDMVEEAIEEAGGMSLADEMVLASAGGLDSDEDAEGAPKEPTPKADEPEKAVPKTGEAVEAVPNADETPKAGNTVDVQRLGEAEQQADRLAGLVHFLQEDNVRLSQEQALIAGEFLRLSTIVSERAAASRGLESGPMAPVKKTGWLMKRNPRAVAGKFKWKRRYFILEGARLRYFENAASTAASGHINLEHYDVHAAKSVSKRLGRNHSFELCWVGDSADASTRLMSCPASKLEMMSGGTVEASGMLQKEGKRNNSFQPRWFVLVSAKEDAPVDPEFEEKRYLLTYESSSAESARSCVCLKDGAYETGTPKKERKGFKQDQVIRLDVKTSGSDTMKLVLATASAKEMQKWRPALERLDHKHGGVSTGGSKVSTYNLKDGSGKTVMPSSDQRGDYCLAAENGEELSDWVELLTKAMVAANQAALEDRDGEEAQEEDPALKVDSKVLDLARVSTRGIRAEVQADVVASVTPPPLIAEQPLPEGWEKHESKDYPGKFFYLHVETNTSQWTLPRERNLTQNPDDDASTWTVEMVEAEIDDGNAMGSYTPVSLSVTAEGIDVHSVSSSEDVPGALVKRVDWTDIVAWNVLGENGLKVDLHVEETTEAVQSWEFRTKNAATIGLAMAAASEDAADVAI